MLRNRSVEIEILAVSLSILICPARLFAESYAPSTAETATATAVDVPQACKFGSYRVVAPYAVLVKCTNAPTIFPDGSSKLELIQKDNSVNELAVQATVARYSEYSFLIYWSPTVSTKLVSGMSYRFTLPYDKSGPLAGTDPLVIPVDTSGAITIVGQKNTSVPEFTISSTVAFALDSHTLGTFDAGNLQWRACSMTVKSASPQSTPFNLECLKLTNSISIDAATIDDLQHSNLDPAGVSYLRLPSFPDVGLIPLTSPYTNVLGAVAKFDPKARFLRPSAPATKDTSQIYLNANYTAGVGSKPAWIVDAKYAPLLRIYHQFALGPLLTANIGNGSIQGQAATDTIDLGGTASKIFRKPTWELDPRKLTFGTTYETDRRFDRDNLLGTVDGQFYWKRFTRTQQMQQLTKWGASLGPDKTSLLSDFSLYQFFGYESDFHLGAEGGGAVVSRIVTASKGGASEVLPQFYIFRVVPQAHTLIQVSRISLEDLLIGRYLTTTEKTIVETATHALYLENVGGWKGINTLTATYALDAQGNFGITIKYTDGFAPPNYKRVNAVQAGIVLKY
jgi:hypothetical protein